MSNRYQKNVKVRMPAVVLGQAPWLPARETKVLAAKRMLAEGSPLPVANCQRHSGRLLEERAVLLDAPWKRAMLEVPAVKPLMTCLTRKDWP